ncbi:MAG: DNA-3-methyladenine glycosylase I [Pseudomonadota bacterium]
MTPFDKLHQLAASRKGGAAKLNKLIGKPKSKAALAKIPDDRWLSEMAKAVFRAGFNWTVVENKWPDIEAAFEGFEPRQIAAYSDEELEQLLKDPRVIRQWRKLKAIRANANYVCELAEEHGSAARYFAHYPSNDYIGLLDDLKKRGSYLGGTTAQYFLRMMGRDSFILSNDVIAALEREKAFAGSPTSKSSLRSIQAAFNFWVDDGGKSLTRVSRILAFTVG